jgi:hypothetical protein
VDEGDQLGIVGRVGPTVGRDAGHPAVHPPHLLHGLLGLAHRAERGGADEIGGAAQPAQGVGLVVGVLRHAGHGQRVQGLQQQRADAADQHGGQIGVHHPGHPVGREIRLVRVRGHPHGGPPEPDRPAQLRARSTRAGRGQAVEEAQGTVAIAPPRAAALTSGFCVGTRTAWHVGRPWQSAGMRVVVFGAGAIGGVVGARLFQHGADVTWWPAAPTRGPGFGTRARGTDETVTLPIPVVTDAAALSWTDDTVVLLAVKGQDTEEALTQL